MNCTAFALLDDRGATDERPSSRLYEAYVRTHRCLEPAQLDVMWARVDADLRAGLHAVLLADYEWGTKLLQAGHTRLAPGDASALRVLMFERLSHLSRDAVDAWLAAQPGATDSAGAMALQPNVDRAAFTDALARIHEAICAGETYQVNYTYRLDGQAYGSPVALYRQLRTHQPVAYGAFIALPRDDGAPVALPRDDGAPIALPRDDGNDARITHVLSCSPELFVRYEAGLLTARPMKGTAPRAHTPRQQALEGDSETARLLSIDIKNRAENLMIVDLLRNDLGRIAQTGSVKVPALFEIEPYATVFQMTSTVQARPRPGVTFADVLRAMFPCGSITGAPKHHTMELIEALETTPRGLYCGAIGWVDAATDPAQPLGDFCLSVAIRTVTLGPSVQGLRPLQLGVGAGIVLDSRADDEFDECRFKTRFLTALDPGFELFETMLAVPGSGVPHAARHLARLGRSACVLGFRFDAVEALDAINACAAMLRASSRLRLALRHDGRLALTHAPLAPLPTAPDGDVLLLVAEQRLPLDNPLAAHKTTLREAYDAGVRAAERAGAFDSLFFDSAGRLVEGGRSSVFLQLEGRWFTPPLADGALPGVMRALVLEDSAWSASERSLGADDLQRAQALMVCNALRGPRGARLHTRATHAA